MAGVLAGGDAALAARRGDRRHLQLRRCLECVPLAADRAIAPRAADPTRRRCHAAAGVHPEHRHGHGGRLRRRHSDDRPVPPLPALLPGGRRRGRPEGLAEPMRVAGLMSGTSLDAIDVAIVDFVPRADALELSLVVCDEAAWPDELARRLAGWLADPHAALPLGELVAANMDAGHAMADALLAVARSAGVDPGTIDLVVSHGQTLHHRVDDPGRAIGTLQIGEPAVIAEHVGRNVVADLRPRDIAAGGQGAPLVALFDALYFGEAERDVAVLNLGGIANVTVIPAARPRESIAWDVGPGNAVLDALARQAGRRRDDDGHMASRGAPDERVLDELMNDRWFAAGPPKSTGRERFGDAYAAALVERGLAEPDLFATATTLTARSVARALADHAPAWPAVVWAGGGGTRNPALMGALGAELRVATPSGASVAQLRPTDEAGIPSGSKEAIAFAFLGHETFHGRPSSLVGATGARHSSVLGAIWPAGPGAHRRDRGDARPGGLVRRLR